MSGDVIMEEFELFCKCSCLKTLLQHHQKLCDLIGIKPSKINEFYPTFKSKFDSWKWKSFWEAFDRKASTACYEGGRACADTSVLVVGAGPVGLRAAIEAQLLGARVVVMEMRGMISRHNVLHLWQFVIEDLKALNAKKFYAKFCAGGIEHISIRRLQFMLLKVALILGVEVHVGVGYEGLNLPAEDGSVGWRAKTNPPDHALAAYEFDVIIGANGKHHALQGFGRKSFRGKLAIAITANFVNGHTPVENQVAEIAGVASVYRQQFFADLRAATGARLENIVYYKDETHYFVMTAVKECLLEKGVILADNADPVQLLSAQNRNKAELEQFALDVCRHCTENKLPNMEFALTHHGERDVAMFDFTHMFSAEHACRVDERGGRRLLQMLVGDSLLEPFWPTGSGCARGFLSAMDAAWTIKRWNNGQADPLTVIAERESVYRTLPQAENNNVNKNFARYTIDPMSRYPFVDMMRVQPGAVQHLYVVDGPIVVPARRPDAAPADASTPDWVLQDTMLVDETDDGRAAGDVDMSDAGVAMPNVDEDDYRNFDISFSEDENAGFDSRLGDDADYAMPALDGGDGGPGTIGAVLREMGLDPNSKLTRGQMASVKKALLNAQGQTVDTCKSSKVTVVGAGRLGTACAYTLLLKGICCNVVLVDPNEEKLRGEAMDLTHGSSFMREGIVDSSTGYDLSEGSKVVVIAASARTQPGEDRKHLLRRNCDVIKDVVPKVVAKSPDCVLIVATPPVDVMTYAAWRSSGFPHHRVFGAGTNLASKRLRAMIADRLNVNNVAVDAWIIGEHGENSVPVWSSAGVGGVRLRSLVPTVGAGEDDPEEWNKMHEDIVSSAKEVVRLKGHNPYSQALNVAALAKSVLKNTRQVMAVSTYIKGCKHGVDKAVYMSLPCVIGADGISYIVKQQMEEDEKKQLHQAANKMYEEQTWLQI